MAQGSTSKNSITEGIIWKQLLIFFFPIVLGTFFQQLYNTADTIVVGQFVGKEALAAVGGSANQIVNLIVGFFVGLSSGATVIIAQHYGARSRGSLNKTLHTAFAIAIVGSIIISVLGFIFVPFLLKLMKTQESILDTSILYLRVYFAGIIFVFIYNMGSGILRAVGDSKHPLYFLIVCCVINIVLDVVFVVVFDMGVLGVAFATLIAQAVSAILVTITLMRSTDIYRLKLRRIRFNTVSFYSILFIGIPSGFQTTMYNIANMFIQSSLNQLGTDTVAAWTVLGKLDAFNWMIISAFGIAVTTFIGQNYGALKFDRVRKSTKICLGMTLVTTLLLSIIFVLSAKFVFGLFTTDKTVIDIGFKMLMVLAPAYIIYVPIEILSGALRGIGNVIVPMVLTCMGVCVLRIVWLIVVVPKYNTVESILYSFPISWAITAILFIIYYIIKQKKFPLELKMEKKAQAEN
ncbi:MATE family efflux transporter [Tyzzerella sp. An114]|uniref:MATE family efflux transporter n=1 Tax=Tyzzerella sp. An114 TaxID=1965545 RepID=UPI000B443CB3|nr:MATE family efflux transporter [Tyzzerella sp. An114]OUQ60029.1 MATE family efflux transporter [Tyzzerella sp. An114]